MARSKKQTCDPEHKTSADGCERHANTRVHRSAMLAALALERCNGVDRVRQRQTARVSSGARTHAHQS